MNAKILKHKLLMTKALHRLELMESVNYVFSDYPDFAAEKVKEYEYQYAEIMAELVATVTEDAGIVNSQIPY